LYLYQVRVNPELIKEVPQPTVVFWGEEDDVLPVEDADWHPKVGGGRGYGLRGVCGEECVAPAAGPKPDCGAQWLAVAEC